jgi:uncharacterized damage-inducible protein DinB
MTKDDIQLLFEFDRWANNMVLQTASTLSAEEFTRDLGGSFRSVRDTLVHIVGVERGWLTCWKEPSPSSTFVKDYWTRHNALFNPNAFLDLAAVQLKWAEIEREQVEFVNRVTNESLGRMLPVYATQISLAHLMQHLANHSTYHRGQVSLMMRQLAAGRWASPTVPVAAHGISIGAGTRQLPDGRQLFPNPIPEEYPVIRPNRRQTPIAFSIL